MTQPDTICALATATGGAIGIIRVSGPRAFDAVSSLCAISCAECKANTLHFTRLATPKGEVIDEVILAIFRAPHSYTGEDAVEISCHGSRYILNKVLEQLVENGCRMARPGEYTMRAFLNGKMDLSQAEAVADLIASTNRATHQMAMAQLRGHFSSELKDLRDQLLKLTSLLELELDFSDHEDLQFADRSELLQLALTIETHIARLARSFETGQTLKQGIPVAIVGKTNVGKSTLLNRLLKDDRAIVSDIHGTTRDTIEDTMEIQGATFRFIDTAGIRQTSDVVEQMGIDRTYQTIEKARIVLWLFDEAPTEAEISDMAKRCEGKALIPILNKADLKKADASPVTASPLEHPNVSSVTASLLERLSEAFHASLHQISAKFDDNLHNLETAIYAAADIPTISDADVIVTNARHYEALIRAHSHLRRVIIGLGHDAPPPLAPNQTSTNSSAPLYSALPPDLISEDLRLALDALADITGQITPQDTLNNIFATFCVGK